MTENEVAPPWARFSPCHVHQDASELGREKRQELSHRHAAASPTGAGGRGGRGFGDSLELGLQRRGPHRLLCSAQQRPLKAAWHRATGSRAKTRGPFACSRKETLSKEFYPQL